MTWEDCRNLLDQELELLGWHEHGHPFDDESEEAGWSIQQEIENAETVERAVLSRLRSGAWPSDLPTIVRFLAGLRVWFAISRTEAFEAWGHDAPPTVEAVLEALAWRGWPILRFAAHCEHAVPPLLEMLDNPWAANAPPHWMR